MADSRVILLAVFGLLLLYLAMVDAKGGNSGEVTNSALTKYCKAAAKDLPSNCLDLLCQGYTMNGIYRIYPYKMPLFSINAVCDQTTSGGGWLVFQRRMDGNFRFYRNWSNYKFGFGNLYNEFWLGNYIISKLSLAAPHELRVDMEDFSNVRRYALYSSFSLSGEEIFFTLTVTGYSGDAGDSLSLHTGQKFSTFDRDNDRYVGSCSQRHSGAWWYNNCLSSNLNGVYTFSSTSATNATAIFWQSWKGETPLKTAEMKMRPKI